MRLSTFVMLLCTTAVCCVILLLSLSYHEVMGLYVDIGWYAMAIFSVLSIVVYTLTNKLKDTKNKVLFIQVILTNMILKMMLSGVIAFVYYQVKQPADGLFIVPFLIVYVTFTVFETYFMNKQAEAR